MDDRTPSKWNPLTTILFVSIGVGTICSAIAVTISIINAERSERFKNRLVEDYLQIQSESRSRDEILKATFVKNCLLARQVYQLYWFEQVPSKLGMLNLKRRYAMSLQEFNDIVEMSWDFNRRLGLPKDSCENYVMLAKWTMESAICNQVEHRTGEIIRMLGYTEDGARAGIYAYEHALCIQKGHPLFVEGLQSGISTEQIKKIFEDAKNCVRFDYAYFSYLLPYYNYSWEWALTSFHYGDDKTQYWKQAGLVSIPNYRIDGHWSGEWIKNYYQSILEMAQGMYEGRMQPISRYEEIVGAYAKMDESQRKYIETMRIKLRTEEQFERLEKKYNSLGEEFKDYKASNDEIIRKMAVLNDLNLDLKSYQDGEAKRKFKERISELKKDILLAYNKIIGR